MLGKLRLAAAAGLAVAMGFGGTALAADTTGVTDTTIEIGMFGPLTGPSSAWGYPIDHAAMMIYMQANAAGGVNGRKFHITEEDDGCDVAKAVAAVKKLIYQDKVFLINGGVCSLAVMAAREDIADSKVPYMVLGAASDKITVPVIPNIFTAQPQASAQGPAIADKILLNPAVKRVAVVRHSDEWSLIYTVPLIKKLKARGIAVDEEVVDRQSADTTTQVLKVKEFNPDATALIIYPAEIAVFLRDAAKYGLKGPFIGTGAAMDLVALARRAGSPDFVRDFYALAILRGSLDEPVMKPYVDLLKKNFPSDKVLIDSFQSTGGARVVVEAIRRAGRDLSRERVIAELDKMRNFDASPLPCPVSFSPTDHQGCKTLGPVLNYRDGKIVSADLWGARK
jgi:branched-chain amino acid transport system substrate-binding protein